MPFERTAGNFQQPHCRLVSFGSPCDRRGRTGVEDAKATAARLTNVVDVRPLALVQVAEREAVEFDLARVDHLLDRHAVSSDRPDGLVPRQQLIRVRGASLAGAASERPTADASASIP